MEKKIRIRSRAIQETVSIWCHLNVIYNGTDTYDQVLYRNELSWSAQPSTNLICSRSDEVDTVQPYRLITYENQYSSLQSEALILTWIFTNFCSSIEPRINITVH